MNQEERRLWMALTAFAVAVAFGLGYFSMYVQKPSISSVRFNPGSIKTAATSQPIADAPVPGAMSRLGKALRKHPGVKAEQVIATVNASAPLGAAKPCPFQWRNHDAELVLRQDAEGQFALASTISTCAESINRTPQ